MKSNPDMHAALTRAIGSLNEALGRDMQRLTLPDCATILNLLPNVPELSDVRAQLATRLQTQLEVPSWIEDGDTYEVFSVFVALWQYDPVFVTGSHLAAAIRRLINTEVTTGGPYYSHREVTVSANAQIAIFMRLVAKPLPNVNTFLSYAIAARHFDDHAVTEPHLIYLLGRASDSPELTQYVAGSWQQDDWQTPSRLATAIAVLKDDAAQADGIDQALQTLAKQQLSSGLWYGELPDSSYVITALVVGVLADFAHDKSRPVVADLRRRQRAVAVAAREMFSPFAEPLRSLAFTAVNNICQADKNFEITLLPHFFAEALKTPEPLADHARNQLGLASLYVWIAYTIYDDFLDGEGEPSKLPIANIAMRASLDCFRSALPVDDFQRYTSRVFAGMDETNAWEVSCCRFKMQGGVVVIPDLPNYNQRAALALRSFAHALGPMALLAPRSPKNVERIEAAFKHYLIARQLNDDLHDWLHDMQTGQASYVVTAVLRDLRVKPGTYALTALVPAMQKCFRQKTMVKVCRQIQQHVTLSKREFVRSRLLRPVNNIYKLLDNLEVSVQHSLDKHAKAAQIRLF